MLLWLEDKADLNPPPPPGCCAHACPTFPPQFIEGRLEKLNSGESFGDPFEEQITCCGSSSGDPSLALAVRPSTLRAPTAQTCL